MRFIRSKFLNRVLLCTLIFAAFGAESLRAADATLTEDERVRRREEFDQAAKEELTIQRKKKAGVPEKPWSLSVSVNGGYDNNVTLDSRRLSDNFHQETVSGQVLYYLPRGSNPDGR